MRIKRKVNLLIITTVAILLTGLVAGLFFFSIDSLMDIEQHESMKNSVTAENYLDYKISSLDKIGRDWAYWDSSYYFMDDRNSEYIVENLPESSFINLDLNAILFFDANGDFFYGRYYNPEKGIFTEIPDSLVNALMQNSFVKNPYAEGSSSGFIEADGEIYMVSINPLLKSSLEGPVKGTFVLAKLLSGDYFPDISHEINLNVEFLKISENGYSEMISNGKIPYIVYNEEGDELSVISPLYDINKNTVAVLKVTENRDLFSLGINSIILHSILAILTCVVIIIIIRELLLSQFLTIQ
ncbi:MAG: CHASE4 domain-containing protein [Methanomicrobium sp.]|nr:CHASE4 domain-containing protein [Methanomicrobium sp.]